MTLSPPSLVPLFRSNEPPSPFQKILVGNILLDQQAELSALGDEISQLESTLRALRRKHADLAAEMQKYSCILSPIRHVPPEIIGEIFLYFAPSAVHPSDFRHRSNLAVPVALPWKLGHICSQWRAISLSLGKLWAVLDLGPQWRFRRYNFTPESGPPSWDRDEGLIELPVLPELADNVDTESFGNPLPRLLPFLGYPFPDVKPLPELSEGFEIATSLDYIEKYLQRSGNRPFSFRIWGPDFAAPTLLESLLEHSALWQEIVFIDVSTVLLDRLARFDGNLQGLCRISLIRPLDPAFPYRIAPNLTDLTLADVYVPSEDYSQIPWSQLIRYCEIDCRWDGEQGRLASYRKLTNLRILRLQLSDYASLPSDTTPIVFPKLSAASFHFRRHFGPNTLHAFDMPVLEDFAVECFSTCHFDTLIPYSSPRLKFFRVRAPMCPRDELCDLDRALGKFRDLTEITIDIPDLFSNTDLSRLIPCDDQPPLAPKLAVLRLSNRSFINKSCKWHTLLKMLQARFQPTIRRISRLRTFEFATDHYANDVRVTSGLKALCSRNGWDIRVREGSFPPWDGPTDDL